MRTTIFTSIIIVFIAVLVALNLAITLQGHDVYNRATNLSQLTKSLKLTDLAIWTESRYTRHPSQADRFSAFQDIPSALEHFPAGSLVATPLTMTAFETNDIPRATP